MKRNRSMTVIIVWLSIMAILLGACAQATPAPQENPTEPPVSPTTQPTVEEGAVVEETPVVEEPSAQMGDELIIAQSAALTLFDPQRSYRASEQYIHHCVFDTLLFRLPDMSIAPGLATSWKQVSDTEWELTLQEGVTFHNGEPFNAETVKWNVERVIEPGFQDYAYLESALAGAEVIDDYTVRISTKTLYPTFPNLMTMFSMVPKDYVEEVGAEGLNEKPVGTGPYKFVEWVKDSHITLEYNPDYWNEVRAPTFRQVTFRILPDDATRVAALMAGEVDIVQSLPPDDFDMVDADPNLEAVWVRSVRTPFFRFFPDSAMEGAQAVADIRVREAINHAIDVDAIITGILGGRGFRTATLMTPDFAGYDPSVEPYEYDTQKAMDLLTEAGYGNGFTIDFHTWSSGPAPKPLELAQIAADDLAKVGITANVIPLDLQTALQMQYEKTLSPIHLWSWGGAQFDCREKFWGVFHPDSSAMHILDEELVAMIDELDATADQAERDQICAEMQARVHDQALIVPLFAQPDIYGKSADIKWQPRPDELIFPWEVTPVN